MPRFDRLSVAFKDDTDFQQVLGLFYADILEFHRRAYKFFRRHGGSCLGDLQIVEMTGCLIACVAWIVVFDSLWKTFDLRFQAILESLRRHRDLIDQEANAISIAEAKAWRTNQLEQIRQWRAERADFLDRGERERLAAQVRDAVAWLGASEEQEVREDLCAKLARTCYGADSHWALRHRTIVSWLDRGQDPSVVWLNGKPGAGELRFYLPSYFSG